jgi:hypothetical protein
LFFTAFGNEDTNKEIFLNFKNSIENCILYFFNQFNIDEQISKDLDQKESFEKKIL